MRESLVFNCSYHNQTNSIQRVTAVTYCAFETQCFTADKIPFYGRYYVETYVHVWQLCIWQVQIHYVANVYTFCINFSKESDSTAQDCYNKVRFGRHEWSMLILLSLTIVYALYTILYTCNMQIKKKKDMNMLGYTANQGNFAIIICAVDINVNCGLGSLGSTQFL